MTFFESSTRQLRQRVQVPHAFSWISAHGQSTHTRLGHHTRLYRRVWPEEILYSVDLRVI